jgi:DNA-binding NarL/FixJ family response regulator
VRPISLSTESSLASVWLHLRPEPCLRFGHATVLIGMHRVPRKPIDTHKRHEVPEPTRVERRLSDRETSVVRLVAEGRPNKEIGRILNISLKTVETYRAAAMRKLRLSSLAGLVRYAARTGLIKP